jgi:hypothetical protein
VAAALASATLIVAASLTVGQAALTVCGRAEARVAAGPAGLALLLATAAIVAGLDGRGAAIAIALGVVLLASVVVLVRSGLPAVPFVARVAAIIAALVAGLAAAIPFIAAGRVGILGVGLVNDDMASHLLLADWIAERFDPEPVLVHQGYPLGPHALVAGVGWLLDARTIDVFAGLVLAIPGLTAFLAAGVLSELRPLPRIAAAALVSLPYLAAAYLAQEAFKEPIMALLLLGFAVLLPFATDWRGATPLGVIAAGSVYVYSFPGLAWLAGTALIYACICWWRGGEERDEDRLRQPLRIHASHLRRIHAAKAASAALAALLALVVLTVLDWDRLRDFVDFRALDPDRANEGGLGNLRGHLSPLEALGIWPTSEFRLSAGEGSGPAVAFYAGAVVALAALVAGLPGWVRRYGVAIPAALGAAVVMYVVARAFGTVYSEGKALAITAPLVALIALGWVGETTIRRALAVAFAAGVAVSSFLVLRQAPVAPEDHMDELAQMRPVVAGEKVLFLGRDNFVLWELRGAKPFTHVRNFYDPYFVEPNFELRDAASKFDFDSVDADTLARFPYVITTRAAYASGAPPDYEAVVATPSYVLWRKEGPVARRSPVEDGPAPGARLDCGRREPRGEAAVFPRRPLLTPASEWSSTTVEPGSTASIELTVPRGVWEVSIQYDSTRPVTLSGPALDPLLPGYRVTLPGNLDYRGTTPFWPAGKLDVGAAGGRVRLTATVEDPPFVGSVMGADPVAHIGAVALTKAGAADGDSEPPTPGEAERVVSARLACGGYADWLYGP